LEHLSKLGEFWCGPTDSTKSGQMRSFIQVWVKIKTFR